MSYIDDWRAKNPGMMPEPPMPERFYGASIPQLMADCPKEMKPLLKENGEALMCRATLFDDGTLQIEADLCDLPEELVKHVRVWDTNSGAYAYYPPKKPAETSAEALFKEACDDLLDKACEATGRYGVGCQHGNFDIYRRCGRCGVMVRENRMAETVAATRGEGREC